MNIENLYEGEEVNGEATFYVDKNCTVPYTGHIEYYFNNKLSWECDIVNGLMNGIEKEYYDNTGELERIGQVKNNMGYGLCVEYYKNGKVSSISLVYNTVNFDSYSYDEQGVLQEIYIMNENNSFGISYSLIKDKIFELREKYSLEKLNEEILNNKNFSKEYFCDLIEG